VKKKVEKDQSTDSILKNAVNERFKTMHKKDYTQAGKTTNTKIVRKDSEDDLSEDDLSEDDLSDDYQKFNDQSADNKINQIIEKKQTENKNLSLNKFQIDEKSKNDGSRTNLLEDIRNGIQLKKVEPVKKKVENVVVLSPQEKKLAEQMKAIRNNNNKKKKNKNLEEEEEEEEEI
jgi:hypothetical protein